MKKKKSSLADKIFVVCNTLFMIGFVVITLYPVLNTLAISFNDGIDAIRGGIYLLPRKFTLKNYDTVLHKQNMLTGAYISVMRTILGTALSLAANALLAFIVSRKRFLFKSQLSLFWVVTMYVNGGMIPVFLLSYIAAALHEAADSALPRRGLVMPAFLLYISYEPPIFQYPAVHTNDAVRHSTYAPMLPFR